MSESKIETTIRIDVPPGQEGGTRLDLYLTAKLANVTRAKVQRGIRDGNVDVNGIMRTKVSHPVQPGDRIVCRILRPPTIEVVPEDIPLDVVFEDEWLLVVNKPAGMVVHPAYGHRTGTLVNALLHHVGGTAINADALEEDADDDDTAAGAGHALGLSTAVAAPRFAGDLTIRPGLVHRLDKDTSGLLVVAKDDFTHSELSKQFINRSIRRCYLAVVWGVPESLVGRIETWLGRSSRDRKQVAVVPEERGKWAATNYETVEAFQHTALLHFRLETGRTHQIRVHAKHFGHPILGDTTYGGDAIQSGPETTKRKQFFRNLFKRMPRQALHAHTLGFRHPKTGEALDFEAPMPEDMAFVLERLRAVEG